MALQNHWLFVLLQIQNADVTLGAKIDLGLVRVQ